MLIHLSIKNFAVVKHLDLNVEGGLTAITGETGAGKSIAIDALSLCMGNRADASWVRPGASKAEITSHFAIQHLQGARHWLAEQEMLSDDDPDTCFIRRVISDQGRSRAFINGCTASLQQLKELSSLLLNIHGQNTHLALLKENHQRNILDSFANHDKLLQQTQRCFQDWNKKVRQLSQLREDAQQRKDRQQLLTYQVNELDEFSLEENEFTELESQQKKLSQYQQLDNVSAEALHGLYDHDHHAAVNVVNKHADKLSELIEHDECVRPIFTLLQDALVQLDEAVIELRHYRDKLDADPEHINWVENRYSRAIELARKHHVIPEQLFAHHTSLQDELKQLGNDEAKLDDLVCEADDAKCRYQKTANALSQSRCNAAKQLEQTLSHSMHKMNMPHADVRIQVNTKDVQSAAAHGLDAITMTISVNPGQPHGPLDKVVSGGELSRLGLATQVVSLNDKETPTLIFDEVDTGISGPTASVVGQLLRTLGKSAQVLCVTHLPQVAAMAHNQLFVSKSSNLNETETHVLPLTPQDRVHELARLLAGDTITDSAIENAKALLAQATTDDIMSCPQAA